MARRSAAPCRCAVYARQSRDATSEFSSGDAQHEACRACLDSQPRWVWNEQCYDDAGESGEGIERAGATGLPVLVGRSLRPGGGERFGATPGGVQRAGARAGGSFRVPQYVVKRR